MAEMEKVRFDSCGLSLEGRFCPGARQGPLKGLSPGVVICHPHPLFGGSMDNNVVYALEQGFAGTGFATLSFNFRGTGASEGQWDEMKGEVDDVVSALWHLAGRPEVDSTRIALAGYSFGGLMVLYAAARLKKDAESSLTLKGLCLVSPMPPARGWERDQDLEELYEKPGPSLIIAGTRDRFCPVSSAKTLAMQIGPDARLIIEEGTDHFYWDHEEAVSAFSADFMGPLLSK